MDPTHIKTTTDNTIAMDNEQHPRFYAGGFLVNPQTRSVFLHLRDDQTLNHPNQWAFFGGLQEGNETPMECFIRELAEETGLHIQEEDIQPVCNYLNEERGTWRYIFSVESAVKKSQITLAEGAGCDWLPFDRVFDYDLTEKTRRDLRLFLQIPRSKKK